MKAQNKKNKLLNKEGQPQKITNKSKSRDNYRQPFDKTPNHENTGPLIDSKGLVTKKEFISEALHDKQGQFRNALNTDTKYQNLLQSKSYPTDKGTMTSSKVLRKDTTLIKEKLKSQKKD
ncbi:MAG: hypothetical protein RR812_05305, partial [Vagococcus sp.]